MKPANIPDIPTLSSSTPAEVRKAFEPLRSLLRTWREQGGVPSLADFKAAGMLDSAGGSVLPPGLADFTTPPQITGLTATGAFRIIVLAWDTPVYQSFSHVEVYRNTADNLATAVKIGTTSAAVYSDTPPQASLAVTYYYWVRAINVRETPGPFNATAGTPATTANDPAYLLEVLTNQLTASQLAVSLSSRIDKIDTTGTGLVDLLDALSVAQLNFIADQATWLERLVVEKAITEATVDVDPVTGQISLKALTANILPEDVARINTLEYNLNAANGTILSHTNTLTAQANELTSQDTRLTQAEGDILLRASTAYVDTKTQEVAALISPDAAAVFGGDVPEALLWLLLSAKDAKDETRINTANMAIAQFDIKSNADAIIAEAVARLTLGAQVAANYAALLSEQTARADADSAEASARLILAGRVSDSEAAISQINTVSVNSTSAVARAVATTQTTVDGHTSSIQTIDQTVDGIMAEKIMKVDANGIVASIGLRSDPTGSAVGVYSGKFFIADDSVPATHVYPFIVAGGVVYMNVAMIQDGTITNAKIYSLATDKLYAGSALIGSALIADAAVTNAKIANAILSNNFQTGVSGWYINKDGTAEFRNILARGDVEASSLKSDTLMVNTGNINDLAVTTLKIGNNAVVIPAASSFNWNGSTLVAAGWNSILTATISLPYSGSIFVIANCDLTGGGTESSGGYTDMNVVTQKMRITRGGNAKTPEVVIGHRIVTSPDISGTVMNNLAGNGAITCREELAAGIHVYSLEVWGDGTSSSVAPRLNNAGIVALGTMK